MSQPMARHHGFLAKASSPRGPLLLPAGAVTCRWAKPAATVVARKHPTICSTTIGEKQPAAEATLPGAQEDAPGAPFNWDKCWYPVAVLRDLEPKKPTPMKLLGREFVLWRDVNKEWKCFQDVCPHRLAPLSEGRIEPSDGSLMCSYHGWRFQSDGECTRIPQAIDGGAASGCKNPRSRAKAFPVKVERDLVWVWPDGGPSAFLDSAMTPPAGREYHGNDQCLRMPTYSRELAYPFDSLIENIVDPAHVPFSHHGQMGRRETVVSHKGEKDSSSMENKLSFTFTMESKHSGAMNTIIFLVNYDAPISITYSYGRRKEYLVVFATPVTSGSCKIFLQSVILKQKTSLFSKFCDALLLKGVFFHMAQLYISDGDMVFLNGQARALRRLEQDGKGWDSQYYLPVSCDVAVVGFRRWLHGKIGGGGPTLPNGDPLLQNNFSENNRRVLLDRYHTHTKHCSICLDGLRKVTFLKNFALAACVGLAAHALALALALIRGAGGCFWSFAASTTGLLLSGFVFNKMSSFEKKFYFLDYEHWKN